MREASGLVQIRSAGGETWKPAGNLPRPLSEGDGVRTGFNAKAKVELAGGQIEAAGNAHFSIEVDAPGHSSVNALFGTVRLNAMPERGAQVSVRTPTCVVRARGDRVIFRATVAGGGSATIEVEEGVAGVEDNRGASVLLSKGQRVEVDLAGLHEPTAAPTPVQARKNDFMALMRRELGFELGRDQDFAAAARESRRAEHELGRVLTGSDGKRVRVEEFVVRPAANRVSLVVLNGRPDGLSYFNWDGTFDTALPRNLEAVFANLRGKAGAATAWTLTDFTTTRSNGNSSLVERASGGHQVDVNANADPLDDVGTGVYFKTIFDRWGLYANGKLKRGFTGVALRSFNDGVASTTNDPLTGAALGAALPVVVINTSYPDAASARSVKLESYGDGTSITREKLYLEFGGGAAGRASYGDPAKGFEELTKFGGTTIRLTMPANASGVTGLVP